MLIDPKIAIMTLIIGLSIFHISLYFLDKDRIDCENCVYPTCISDIYMYIFIIVLMLSTKPNVWFMFCFLYGLIILLKSFTIHIFKSEPATSNNCKPKMLGKYLVTDGCSDMMFSAHTCFFVLIASLITLNYNLTVNIHVKYLFIIMVWIYALFCIFQILRHKQHHKKDVIVGSIISLLLISYLKP